MTHPTPARWQRMIDQARRLVDELEDQGPLLLARDTHTAQADGWPAGGGEGGSASADTTSSTERAALAEERRDEIHKCATGMVSAFDQALADLNLANGALALARHLSNPDLRHSNPPTPCKACGRTVMCTQADPIRKGYCSACSSAFYRWAKAEEEAGREVDRGRFEQERRREQAA